MGIRFVSPEPVRLNLATVYHRRVAALGEARTALVAANAPPATLEVADADMAAAQRAATQADEEGDFIIVKTALSHGEREDMLARMISAAPMGEIPEMNPRMVRTAKVLAYLLGWSAAEPIGPEVPGADRLSTINSLSADTFDDIDQTIDAHIAATDREKKTIRTVPALSTT